MDAKNTVLSRTTKLNGDEMEAFVDYLPEINLEVPEVDMNKVFSSASEIALRIRMETLDILHISASLYFIIFSIRSAV